MTPTGMASRAGHRIGAHVVSIVAFVALRKRVQPVSLPHVQKKNSIAGK